MKNKHFIFGVVIVSFMIGCSDSEVVDPQPSEKILAVTSVEEMMFKCMTGGEEGGIDGLEIETYKERHSRKMNSFAFSLKNVAGSSITFIEKTDSVRIDGFVSCGYLDHYPYFGYNYTSFANNKEFKYKFEGNELQILNNLDRDIWMTLGYGNKEKIEVYIETKTMATGSSLYYEELADKFVWEIEGHMANQAYVSVSPEWANQVLSEQNWGYFFDEVRTYWVNAPNSKYFGNTFKSQQDMKYKYQGATWSVHKITYLPEIQ